jgi:hypothetical protein
VKAKNAVFVSHKINHTRVLGYAVTLIVKIAPTRGMALVLFVVVIGYLNLYHYEKLRGIVLRRPWYQLDIMLIYLKDIAQLQQVIILRNGKRKCVSKSTACDLIIVTGEYL